MPHVRPKFSVRPRWAPAMLSAAIIIGAFASSAQAAGSPVPGSPVASGVDCLLLYKGYFPPAAPGSACVNFITGSADAPPVDIYVDGVKVVENQEYAKDVVNAIYAIPGGKPFFQVTAAGDPVDKALLEKHLEIAPGQVYDIVIFDPVAAMRIRAFPVDVSALPAEASRVRVINATQDEGTIDGYLVQGPNSINEGINVGTIKFGKAGKYKELTWAADETDLSVTSVPTGTVPPNDIGHASRGGPGYATDFILVGQSGRLGTYVTTIWTLVKPT